MGLDAFPRGPELSTEERRDWRLKLLGKWFEFEDVGEDKRSPDVLSSGVKLRAWANGLDMGCTGLLRIGATAELDEE